MGDQPGAESRMHTKGLPNSVLNRTCPSGPGTFSFGLNKIILSPMPMPKAPSPHHGGCPGVGFTTIGLGDVVVTLGAAKSV